MRRPLALFLLALVTVPTVADPPPIPGRVVFSTVTFAEAQKLDGHRARVVVVLDSAEEQRGGYLVYDCRSRDDALRSVWLMARQDVAAEMTVAAVLRLRYVPAAHGFAGFWEYRLTEARRAK
jgi:hypothetical protein